MRNYLSATIFLISIAALVMLLMKTFPNAINNTNKADFYKSILVIILMSLGFWGRKIKLAEISRNLTIWVLIFFFSILGYSYRFEFKDAFNRVAGNILPSLANINQDGSISFYASDNGHFMVNGLVNASPTNFLLDTGATLVSLTLEDAIKAGFDTVNLNYIKPTYTANGVTFSASILIKELTIGNITIHNIEGSVNKTGTQSLLGMSFLKKLNGFEVTKEKITLYN